MPDEVARLTTALYSRVVIEQAKGVLIGRMHCTPEQAFEYLRSEARYRQQPIRAVAQHVVDLPREEPKETEMSRTIRVLVVPENGGAEVRTMPADLPSLQQAIGGGFIEALYPDAEHPGWHAYCDEEGKFKFENINVMATRFAGELGWAGRSSDVLMGPVVFLGDGEDTADEYGVPDAVLDEARKLWSYQRSVTLRVVS